MKVKNGQPIKFLKKSIRIVICCDCRLRHDVYTDSKGTTHWYRNDYETDRARKKGRKRQRRKAGKNRKK